jgi:hypothetical protein
MIEKTTPVAVDLNNHPSVWRLTRQLLRHPLHSFIKCWNCKAAALSCILRTPVYIITTLRHGWQAITLAAAVKAGFSAGAAGVYAAFSEAVRDAQPEFAVAILLLVILPALTLALDALVHFLTRTPNLRAGVFLSLGVSIVSCALHRYSMRRGTLLIGPGGRSFSSDVAALPMLIARFVGEPFIAMWRNLKMLRVTAVED